MKWNQDLIERNWAADYQNEQTLRELVYYTQQQSCP